MKKVIRILVLLMTLTSLAGCASFGRKLKRFMGGEKKVQKSVAAVPQSKRTIKFSETPNVRYNANRKYKRMTKEKFEKQAKVSSDSGSLWAMEGQDAYLFTQNKSRRLGDILNVKLEGAAKKQLETKVGVIQKLLKKIEKDKRSPFRSLASKKKGVKKAPEKKEEKKPDVANKKDGGEKKDFDVESVSTRIVERLPDGNYRVKGHQAFMIGKKEYKVIVTGIVRSEDYNDEGIGSSQILDPKYDIVSNRRSLM